LKTVKPIARFCRIIIAMKMLSSILSLLLMFSLCGIAMACAQQPQQKESDVVTVELSDADHAQSNDVNDDEVADAPTDAVATDESAAKADDNPAYDWLDRIEARGEQIKTLRATVIYDRRQGILGDRQVRRGQLHYDAGRPPQTPRRFDIHFDRILLDGQLREQDRRYTFDGRWLAERNADDKVFIRRELVAEGDAGRDLLAMGEGPFALPLNLNRQAVTQRFEVSLIEPTEDDPENTVHLRLMPRPNIRVEQDQIDFWFDRDSLLPVMVHTVDDAEAENITIIRLREVEVDVQMQDALFNTQPPTQPGWQIEINPLEPEQDH